VYPKLLEGMPKSVKYTYGDGAYDAELCYAANVRHGSIPIIPPNRNAVFHENASPSWEIRNISLLEISGLGGDTRNSKG
jgi:hypothetical protein